MGKKGSIVGIQGDGDPAQGAWGGGGIHGRKTTGGAIE
jgi:hypothetical protein